MMKEKFFDEPKNSLEWFSGLADTDWDITYLPHRFDLRRRDVCILDRHDNLHIRQLVELRRFRIENITKPYDIQYAGDW